MFRMSALACLLISKFSSLFGEHEKLTIAIFVYKQLLTFKLVFIVVLVVVVVIYLQADEPSRAERAHFRNVKSLQWIVRLLQLQLLFQHTNSYQFFVFCLLTRVVQLIRSFASLKHRNLDYKHLNTHTQSWHVSCDITHTHKSWTLSLIGIKREKKMAD